MATVTYTDYSRLVYDSFIFLLSLLAVINLIISVISYFQRDIVGVVVLINLYLSVFFFGDFLYRFFSTDSKWHYFIFNGGWADLISSVPFPVLKIFRVYRIIEVALKVRKFEAENVVDELSRSRANGAFYVIIFWIVLIIEFGSILILHAERLAENATILSAGDAIWWSIVTITTVGYGDLYPVTSSGRVVAIILMVSGVGVFGTMAGFLSTKLVTPKKRTDQPPEDKTEVNERKLDEVMVRLDAQLEVTNSILLRLKQYEEAGGGGSVLQEDIPGDSKKSP